MRTKYWLLSKSILDKRGSHGIHFRVNSNEKGSYWLYLLRKVIVVMLVMRGKLREKNGLERNSKSREEVSRSSGLRVHNK